MQRVFYPTGTKLGKELLSLIPDTEAIPYSPSDLDSLSRESGDILIANTRLPINAETFERFPGFQGFATVSSGIDHVNYLDLKKYQKEFINAPGCNAGSVAEYVWFGVQQLLSEDESILKDQSIQWGIVGMGNVGRALSEILRMMGASYTFYDPNVDGGSTFSEVIRCRLVTLHVPLLKEGLYPTQDFFHTGILHEFYANRGKKIFINTSRGEVVSYEFLAHLLEDKDTVGILDVFSPEPPDRDSVDRFLRRRDWIYTPHIAGYSQEGRGLGTYIVARKLAERIGRGFPYQWIDFLKSQLPWKSRDFIRIESNLLVDSWESGNFGYFESRRNDYPLREDANLIRWSSRAL